MGQTEEAEELYLYADASHTQIFRPNRRGAPPCAPEGPAGSDFAKFCVCVASAHQIGHLEHLDRPTLMPEDSNKSGVVCILSCVDKTQGGNRPDRLLGFDHLARAGLEQGQERIPAQEGPGHGPAPHRREGREAAMRTPSSRAGLTFGAHQAKPSAEARFAGLTENGYTTNQSQESTCLTMLRNECCVGYWKAGGRRVGCCYKMSDYGVRVI